MRRLFSFFFNAETRLARGKYVVRPVTLFLCFFIMSSASFWVFSFFCFSAFKRRSRVSGLGRSLGSGGVPETMVRGRLKEE